MKPDDADLRLDRLNVGDGPELHRALAAAKQQLPSAQQLAALAASLSAVGVAVAPAAPVPTAAPASTHWRLWLTAGVLGPVVLALVFWPSKAPRATSPRVVATPSASTAERASAPLGSATEAGVASARPGGSSSAPADLPDSGGAPLEVTSAGVAPELPKNPPSRAAQIPSATSATAALASTGQVARAPGVAERAGVPSSASASAVAPPTEIALLRDAQLALRTNPSSALALTEQHRALFARGAMVQERELIAISALARLNRHTAVLARAAQFAHDFPSSPYRKQIEALAQ